MYGNFYLALLTNQFHSKDSVLLVFTCGLRYPKEAPIIEVRWSGLRASLSDLQHAMLQTLLDTKASIIIIRIFIIVIIRLSSLSPSIGCRFTRHSNACRIDRHCSVVAHWSRTR